MHREQAASAYTGLVDGDLRYAGGRYQLSGSAISTRTSAAKERRHGYIAHLEFDKRGGWLEGETAIAAISRHADLNDLGFLRRNDQVSNCYYLTLKALNSPPPHRFAEGLPGVDRIC